MRSAVVVAVPEAEPVVGAWRLRHTHDAPLGMPPHVTLLFPFVPAAELGAAEQRLGSLADATAPFDVTFARTARFAGVLYLQPEPAEPFARLTASIAAAWPEHPPYEGAHETVIPHLTVAEGDAAVLDRAAAEVEPRLPLRTHVGELDVFAEDAGGRWRRHRRLALGGAA